MGTPHAAEARLLALLHQLDFARRWYDLCAATRYGKPARDLSDADAKAALESTGWTFKSHRKERFYATREGGVPGELGVNLSLVHGVAEFILVCRVPVGHIGDVFPVIMRDVEHRFGPELPESPPYPQPWYQGPAELRHVLAEGFGLYAEIAGAIRASGLLAGEDNGGETGVGADPS